MRCFTSAGTLFAFCSKSQISNIKSQIISNNQNSNNQNIFGILNLGFEIYLEFGFWNLKLEAKREVWAVCAHGFPHSEIFGSKVAKRLPEAYRSHATSFIAVWCQGIHHTPLIKSSWNSEFKKLDNFIPPHNFYVWDLSHHIIFMCGIYFLLFAFIFTFLYSIFKKPTNQPILIFTPTKTFYKLLY